MSKLDEEIQNIRASSALLVFDAGLKKTPWPERAHDAIESAGLSVLTFADIEPNPRATTIDEAAELARDSRIDVVIGLGGGSVLDAAKTVAVLLRNPGSCMDYEGRNRFDEPAAPFVAVPTTCGTGSEVTWVSVISDRATLRKISVKGDGMFPTVALVDADLIETLPPNLIAETGMDALTHAVEAFVSRFACPITDVLALEAVRLLLTHLEACVADPGEPEPRTEVMKASTVAGMAFGNADVGAVHCLSESIGGVFDHPHGLLNAILLTPVLRYQIEAIGDRLHALSKATGGPDADILERIETLAYNVGIMSFDGLGVPAESYDRLSEMAVLNGSNDANRMEMGASDYSCILETLS